MRKRKGKTKKKARSDTSSKAKRVYKKKARRANAAPLIRNAGKWTESEFWQMIRSSLRNRTRFWAPKLKALTEARRSSQSANKRLKWEFKCCKCENWFPQKMIEVHHTIPAGSLRSGDDLKPFVENLFAEEGYAVVCKPCHKLEHAKK
jgi:hypothetical protein